MKNLNYHRALFIGIMIVVAAMIVTASSLVFDFSQKNYTPYINNSNNQIQSRLDLQSQYKSKLKSLLNEDVRNYSELETIKEKVFDLRVPTEYKDLQLKLAILMDKLETNEKLDKETESEFNLLMENYSWLSNALANFLINNF